MHMHCSIVSMISMYSLGTKWHVSITMASSVMPVMMHPLIFFLGVGVSFFLFPIHSWQLSHSISIMKMVGVMMAMFSCVRWLKQSQNALHSVISTAVNNAIATNSSSFFDFSMILLFLLLLLFILILLTFNSLSPHHIPFVLIPFSYDQPHDNAEQCDTGQEYEANEQHVLPAALFCSFQRTNYRKASSILHKKYTFHTPHI